MTQQQMDLVYSLYLMTMQTQPITVLCTVYYVLCTVGLYFHFKCVVPG